MATVGQRQKQGAAQRQQLQLHWQLSLGPAPAPGARAAKRVNSLVKWTLWVEETIEPRLGVSPCDVRVACCACAEARAVPLGSRYRHG